MKKVIALLLALTMLFSLAACGGSDEPEQPDSTANSAPADGEAQQPSAPQENAPVNPGSGESTVREETDAPQYGGEITTYLNEMYTYFDPAMDENKNYCLWLETLWAIDWSINDPSVASFSSNSIHYTQMAGQIAKEWDDLESFMANGYLDVTIRDDVYFQVKDEPYNIYGGRQLKAEDVAYSYNRLLGANGVAKVSCETDWATQLFMLDPENAAEALDDYTVRFHFTTVTESALDIFICRPINIGGAEWDSLTSDQQGDWHYACGTGPYILTDFAADNYYYFTRNDNYYDYDERYPENRLPYIDNVKMICLKDTATVATQFIAGELDWFNNIYANLSDSELAQLRDSGKGVEMTFATTDGSGINFKCNHEPFSDINVRKALQKAINLEEIYSEYYGYTDELVVPAMFTCNMPEWVSYANWSDELKAEYQYDPEAAMQMLDEAGYPAGSDGIRFQMTIQIGSSADATLFTLIQSYLAAVGVDMQIETATDQMAIFANRTDRESPLLATGQAGEIKEVSMASVFLMPGGPLYTFNDEESEGSKKFAELLGEMSNASYLADQNEIAQELDVLFASQHWQLIIAPFRSTSEFWSTRVHGYTSEMMTNGHMRNFMLPRLWVVD